MKERLSCYLQKIQDKKLLTQEEIDKILNNTNSLTVVSNDELRKRLT